MVTIEVLGEIASQFAAHKDELVAYAEGKWTPEEGLEYITLSRAYASSTLRQMLPEDVSVEFIKVTGELAPHYHSRSDAAVVVLGDTVGAAMVPTEEDHRRWRFVHNQSLILIPRGIVHGFRPDEATNKPFYLIAVEHPRIADDDITYL